MLDETGKTPLWMRGGLLEESEALNRTARSDWSQLWAALCVAGLLAAAMWGLR